MSETMKLLVTPARDRNAADKLTLTLHGPKGSDRERLVQVLAHLLQDNSEWNGERPNVDFVVSTDG